MHYAAGYFNYLDNRCVNNSMLNRKIVMDYTLSCLEGMVESGLDIKPDSDLVNDLGLESDISIPINILLDVKTPAQLLEALIPYLENTNGPL